MTKNSKKLTAAIGLGLGVTIFAGAAFAGYNTSNGYEVGKTAAKGLLSNENYTARMTLKVSVDGEEIAYNEMTELYDRNGDVNLNRAETGRALGEDGRVYRSYAQDGDHIAVYTYEDENGELTEHTSVYHGKTSMSNGNFDPLYTLDEDDKNTMNKVVRFVELAADTLVGDLKNNIVYIAGDDNSATYEMNLDAVQIPELANAGLSALFSSMSSSYDEADSYDDPFLVLGTDPIVKNAYLKFTVDNEGRLTGGIMSGSMVGGGHEATIEITLTMSDYGITEPQRVDVSTLEDVEEFNVDKDGAVRSVTTVGDVSIEGAEYVDMDGNVIDEDGDIVGHIEIDENGEGTVVYND